MRAIGLILLLSLSTVVAHAQRIPEHLQPRVALDVSGPSSIEPLVRSYLTRELRSIPDIILVNDDGDFNVTVVAMELSAGREILGIALSVVVLEAIPTSGLVSVAVAESGLEISQEQVFEISTAAQQLDNGYGSLVTHRLLTGPQNSLQSRCQEIIADFDGELLESQRRLVRDWLRDQ